MRPHGAERGPAHLGVACEHCRSRGIVPFVLARHARKLPPECVTQTLSCAGKRGVPPHDRDAEDVGMLDATVLQETHDARQLNAAPATGGG